MRFHTIRHDNFDSGEQLYAGEHCSRPLFGHRAIRAGHVESEHTVLHLIGHYDMGYSGCDSQPTTSHLSYCSCPNHANGRISPSDSAQRGSYVHM